MAKRVSVVGRMRASRLAYQGPRAAATPEQVRPSRRGASRLTSRGPALRLKRAARSSQRETSRLASLGPALRLTLTTRPSRRGTSRLKTASPLKTAR